MCHGNIPKPLELGMVGEGEGVRRNQLPPSLHIQHPHLQLEHRVSACMEREGGEGRRGEGREGGGGKTCICTSEGRREGQVIERW